MNLREQQEEYEATFLNQYASKSSETKGRKLQEEKCDIRTEYQRDRDRIIHSKAFRRLKQKTQVFISPSGDHYRTRLTHTLEVAQISRTIARALRLNEDLTEAIALGHDLGHTPFGHSGEFILNKISPYGFKHNEQSIRVVEKLEHDGKGLNLTLEVLDGILNHKTSGNPSTLEGKIVQLSDKIAYINHDIDDSIRGGILTEADLPKSQIKILGADSSERIDKMIRDTIYCSLNTNDISIFPETKKAMSEIRSFLFENVYTASKAKYEETKAQNIIHQLYDYFLNYPEKLSGEFKQMLSDGDEPIEKIVCDYIAGMTDLYSKNLFCNIFVPMSWDVY